MSTLFRERRRRRFGGEGADGRGAAGPRFELRATRSLEFEYAEALRAGGAEDSGSPGATGLVAGRSGCSSERSFGTVSGRAESGGLGCDAPKVHGALGVEDSFESWVLCASRSHGVVGCTGAAGAAGSSEPGARQLCSCVAHVAQRAISEKARKLVQVGGLGDEGARLWAVNALEACRQGEGQRFRCQRPGRETS